jgi:hypothetical protein
MKQIAIAVLYLVIAAPAAVHANNSPRAVVTLVSGSATVTTSGAKAPLRLFDWLAAGTDIQVAPASRVVIAFADGRRWELHDNAAATVTESGLTVSSPKLVKQLTTVPALPRLPAAVSTNQQRVAAVRVRGVKVTGLYPDGEAMTVADATVLRWNAVPGAASYKVTIENESGDVVFSADTTAPSAVISPGILEPAARYFWQVRTIDRGSPVARGEAEFSTLSAEQATSRAALRSSLEGDMSSLTLLAEVDRSLGLLWEARESLTRALARSPHDDGLRAALAGIDARLQPDRNP